MFSLKYIMFKGLMRLVNVIVVQEFYEIFFGCRLLGDFEVDDDFEVIVFVSDEDEDEDIGIEWFYGSFNNDEY